jgi:eukaryotic-like serine/threonine-protein kinase
MGGLASDRIGSVIARSYRIVRVLGEGGMGTVFEAEHTRVPRKFAVKVLKAECATNAEMFGRFRREAEIASSIGHENIIEALDFDVLEDGAPYIVLEHLEGEHLGERIGRRGRLSVEETVEILEDTASALHAAHDRGIVHRDLKPQNLFLIRRGKRDNFVKVLDFGISKVLHDGDVTTKTGTYLGTPNYMAPEQLAEDHGPVDRRADIWALAAIAYECLSGRMAFAGPTVSGTFFQIVHGEPTPLRSINPGVPEDVVRVIMRGLAKKPEARFQSAKEMSDALLKAIGRAPTQGRVPTLSLGLTPLPDRQQSADNIGYEPTQANELPTIPARPDTLQASTGAIPMHRPKRWPIAAAAVVAVLGAVVLLRRTPPTTPSPATPASSPTAVAPPPPPVASSVEVVAPATSPVPPPAPSTINTSSTAPKASKPVVSSKPSASAAPAPTKPPAIDIGPREKDL